MFARLGISLVAGTVATFVLLWIMQILIATGQKAIQDTKDFKFVDFVRIERQETLETKKPKPKKPPEPDKPPPPGPPRGRTRCPTTRQPAATRPRQHRSECWWNQYLAG